MKRLSCLLLLVMAGLFCLGFAFSKEDTVQFHKERVMVYSGDSLWSIASRRTADGEDVREVIDRIVKENKLDQTQAIQPGQVLIVTVKGAGQQLAVK
ncbi:MAG: LysM peptidoglycan-binding domain-containing protein [Acidaminococcus sp.]|jgi:hypothetical protein|nr:LysM peptidoglycan-binding domain-containing protein [Acidaminococcus sp.]MCI2100502.1 LysM peptidoglycan-binding domain-containing protein [Acidaminococcus sp.]MCI2114837.1 LysM peptidoglycan-binding domain-containing protein [Acidaminococcus sp.]MCI2116876.1 LysM peptidoglycan-binding domain-containing protein [Acidaminococcus sp.]